MPRPRKQVPTGMPAVSDATGGEREALAQFWKQRVQELETAYSERIEFMRNYGEHPSPVFAKLVRIDGALGMPKAILAKKLSMGVDSLMRYYGDDYELGAAEIMSQVAANMLRIGTSLTDPAAATVGMKILDRRGGEAWKPPSQQVQIKNESDAPPVIDSSKLSFEERAQLRTMLTRIAEGGEGDPVDAEEAAE